MVHLVDRMANKNGYDVAIIHNKLYIIDQSISVSIVGK